RLVIWDPIVAYIPEKRKAISDQDVRQALAPIQDLAARTGTAHVGIRHLNKSSGGNPVYRGAGSIALIGTARAAMLVATDPDDPQGERRVLAMTKVNLARKVPALLYSIEGAENGTARIVWGGESEQTAETLTAAEADADEGQSAIG